MTPQRLIMLAFFLQPLAFGSWLPRIPDLALRLQLGPGELALALLGLPIGTLLTLLFAGPLVTRIGGKSAIRYGFVAFLMAISLPGFSTQLIMLFVALLLTGLTMPVLELGLNVVADEVEKSTGKAIMSTCHGCWSRGMAVGSLVGVGLAGLGLPPQFAILLVAALVLLATLPVGRALPEGHRVAPATGQGLKAAGFFVPGPLLLGICFAVFGTAMVEGAAADWSAVYLRDVFLAGPAAAGLGYTLFALLITAGRLVGDRLKQRFGASPVVRVAAGLALLGVGCVCLAPGYPMALFGFGLAGLGASVGFPLAVTVVGSLGDRPAAQNIAVLSLVTLFGFLLGPPLIGSVAELGGLRVGLAMLVPGLILSVVCAGLLKRRPAGSPG